MTHCELCCVAFDPKGPGNRRRCTTCAREYSDMLVKARHCIAPEYAVYRYEMRRKFGPGPWTEDVLGEWFRWSMWRRRFEARRRSA